MKSALYFILALLLHFVSTAQPCPATFLGSKTLYRNPATVQTAAPEGYVPVFINHVGRHGARHVTSDINTSFVYKFLAAADSAEGLTTEGQHLKLKISALEKVEKKIFKSISEEGRLEQRGLADRLYASNLSLFKGDNIPVDIDYTKEVRTLQTSDAFLNELKIKITTPLVTRQINDTTLRFYDLSPAYLDFKRSGSWIQSLEKLKESVHYAQIADGITGKFFKAGWLSKHTEEEKEEFMAGVFGFITILPSIEKEITEAGFTAADLDMQTYFTCEQLAMLDKIDNAEDFYQKGPGTDVNGIQVTIAAPLLANFIATTDEYLRDKKTPIHLRFSHAETISPLASLLSLDPAIHNIWQASTVIPLSANIQWIVYQKTGSKDILVKFLLNENEVPVKGLQTKTYPYYKWKDVRDFYMHKLESLHIAPGQDYFKWLKELK